MTVAVMQPYFLPYLGYWQMFCAVDKFVLLDDVNYIIKGYINRNNILIGGQAKMFTIPLEKPSRNKLICETKLNFSDRDRVAFLRMIACAYRKAPYYGDVYPMLECVVMNPETDLTRFLKYSFDEVKEYLSLSTEIILSSKINKDNSLRAQSRIIAINKALGATRYINAIGGQGLYNKSDFQREGIELKFIKMGEVKYKQFNGDFVPCLSLIDVLMFNSKENVRKLLNLYTLI